MSDYWEKRYRSGGNSGYGSYGRLGAYKAKYLNGLVQRRGIRRVLEFGSGDGHQLSLAEYPEYVGIEPSPTALEGLRARFADDPTKTFYTLDEWTGTPGVLHGTYSEFVASQVAAGIDIPPDLVDPGQHDNSPAGWRPGTDFDLTLSLDVVYHLLNDAEYEAHMEQLFLYSPLVIIYAPNRDGNTDRRNHMRTRRFTDWVDEHYPTWRRRFSPNPIMRGISDFWQFERPEGTAETPPSE